MNPPPHASRQHEPPDLRPDILRCPGRGGWAASTPAPLRGSLTSLAFHADDRPDCQRGTGGQEPPIRSAGAARPISGRNPGRLFPFHPETTNDPLQGHDRLRASREFSLVVRSMRLASSSSPATRVILPGFVATSTIESRKISPHLGSLVFNPVLNMPGGGFLRSCRNLREVRPALESILSLRGVVPAELIGRFDPGPIAHPGRSSGRLQGGG